MFAFDRRQPPFAQATAGALGSITSNTLVYPLDLLSTRCQTQSRGRDGKGGYQSIGAALKEIVDQNGLRGLYQGLGSDTLSNTLSNFLFFYFRSFFMESVKERKRAKLPPAAAVGGKGKSRAPSIVITAAEDLAIGALAGVVSRFFTTPLSNVTVRMQTSANPKPKSKEQEKRTDSTTAGVGGGQPSSDSESDDEGGYAESAGIVDVLRQIVAEKGWLGLWSGFETAALLSISPALTFYSTNAVSTLLIPKERREKPSSLQTFVTSAIGNSISTMIVFPLILCKTRLQWRSPTGRKMYRNLLDVLRKTLRRGGIKGLYQGLDSQLIKGLFSFGTTMVSRQSISRRGDKESVALTLIFGFDAEWLLVTDGESAHRDALCHALSGDSQSARGAGLTTTLASRFWFTFLCGIIGMLKPVSFWRCTVCKELCTSFVLRKSEAFFFWSGCVESEDKKGGTATWIRL